MRDLHDLDSGGGGMVYFHPGHKLQHPGVVVLSLQQNIVMSGHKSIAVSLLI